MTKKTRIILLLVVFFCGGLGASYVVIDGKAAGAANIARSKIKNSMMSFKLIAMGSDNTIQLAAEARTELNNMILEKGGQIYPDFMTSAKLKKFTVESQLMGAALLPVFSIFSDNLGQAEADLKRYEEIKSAAIGVTPPEMSQHLTKSVSNLLEQTKKPGVDAKPVLDAFKAGLLTALSM